MRMVFLSFVMCLIDQVAGKREISILLSILVIFLDRGRRGGIASATPALSLAACAMGVAVFVDGCLGYIAGFYMNAGFVCRLGPF